MGAIRPGILTHPRGLKQSALLAFLSLALMALQVIYLRDLWPSILVGRDLLWIADALALPIVFVFVRILSASWLAFQFANAFAVIWVLSNIAIFYETKRPTFAFLAFGVAVYWLLTQLFTYRQLRRSFLDAGLAWYQELPEMIPELRASISEGERSYELKVSQFDREGGFLFFPGKRSDRLEAQDRLFSRLNPRRLRLSFEFRKFVVSTEARLVRVAEHARGFGVEFRVPNADERKNLYDLIAQLKGEGYVD